MKNSVYRNRFYLLSLVVILLLDWILLDRLRQYSGTDSLASGSSPGQIIADEVIYFPIADGGDKNLTYDFVDTWMAARGENGERSHEGCDIITAVDQRGIYPVVSMTDGVIENIGWLQLGGYRIGIRSAGGIYYYYAHMESYAEGLEAGQEVLAGEFLGFVGDSGYGDEGTTGKFVTHLHVGIYVPNEDGEDTAVNPYPYLQTIRDSEIRAEYTDPG